MFILKRSRRILSLAALAALTIEISLAQSLEESIVGTWSVQTISDTGVQFQQTFEFQPDNNFRLFVTRRDGKTATIYKIRGRWYIEGKTIHYVIEESDHPNVRSNTTDHNEIVMITNDEVVTRGSDGTIVVARKVR